MQTFPVIVILLLVMVSRDAMCAPQRTSVEQLKRCLKNPLSAVDNCRKSCESRAAVLDKFKCELACFMKFHKEIEHCSSME